MDTQSCSKCLEVKPLNQFHRRADKYQHICKSCVSLSGKARYAKNGRKRTTTSPIINKSNIPAIAEIVAGIEPHLRAKANRYSSDQLEADDVYGVMVEAILTKSDPTDSAARILGRADWAATEYLRSKQTYDYRVDASDDDSEAFMTKTSAEDEVVERETSNAMRNIIAQLPTDYQQVVSFLAVGLTQREIAQKLEISEQAVSQKVKRIGSQMMSLGLSPA